MDDWKFVTGDGADNFAERGHPSPVYSEVCYGERKYAIILPALSSH